MRIKISKHTHIRLKNRLKRKARIRKKLFGTSERPRLAVFKSRTNIYIQAIDDEAGKTLFSTSSLKLKEKNKPTEVAEKVGQDLGKKLIQKRIQKAVFDRGGYIYHGRVKAVAEGVRKAGLQI